MKDLLFRIRTDNRPELLDETKAKKIIEAMLKAHPEIVGYAYEINDDKSINLLIWGDLG